MPPTSIARAPFTIAEGLAWNSVFGGQMACDGTNQCLFVASSSAGLRGWRIAKDGVVSSQLSLTSTAADVARDMSFDGTNFIIAYTSGSAATRALRVVPSTGAVVEAGGIAIMAVGSGRIASTNGQTLFTFADGSSQLKGVRLSSTGIVEDATPLPFTTAADAFFPVVAASGTQYLLAWEDSRGGPDADTQRRLSAALAHIDHKRSPWSRSSSSRQGDDILVRGGTDCPSRVRLAVSRRSSSSRRSRCRARVVLTAIRRRSSRRPSRRTIPIAMPSI